MSTENSDSVSVRRSFNQKLLLAGPLAIGASVSANLVVFTVARELLGVLFIMPLRPEAPPVPLPMSMVVMATVIPAIGATLSYGILHNFIPRAVFVFRMAAAGFFLLSIVGPVSLTADVDTKLALALMHLVAGVTIVGVLTTLAVDE